MPLQQRRVDDDGITLSELYEQIRVATTWHRRANCRPSALPPGMDSTWFVPPIDPERSSHWPAKGAAAVRLCRGCPVRRECGEDGKGQVGIWGGVLQARNPWATGPESAAGDRQRFQRHLEKTNAP